MNKGFMEFVVTNQDHGQNLLKARNVLNVEVMSFLSATLLGGYAGYFGRFGVPKISGTTNKWAGLCYGAFLFGTPSRWIFPEVAEFIFGKDKILKADAAFLEYLRSSDSITPNSFETKLKESEQA